MPAPHLLTFMANATPDERRRYLRHCVARCYRLDISLIADTLEELWATVIWIAEQADLNPRHKPEGFTERLDPAQRRALDHPTTR